MTARALHPVNRGARETSRSFSDGALLARGLRSLVDSIVLPMALLAFAMVAFVSVAQAEGTVAAAGAADADSEMPGGQKSGSFLVRVRPSGKLVRSAALVTEKSCNSGQRPSGRADQMWGQRRDWMAARHSCETLDARGRLR